MKIELPKQLLEIIDKLTSHGYKAYVCGKCVATLLKGQSPLDFDMLTNAEIPRIRAVFELELPDAYEEEILIKVLGVAANIKTYTDLKSELFKNALTIHSLAYNPEEGFIDFFGGLKHNKQNIIAFTRPIGRADIFPALSLAASEEYAVAPEAKEAVLANCSETEFNRELFEQIIMGKKSGEILRDYADVFKAAVPELQMFGGFEDIMNSTFKSVGCSSPILPLRYALFFSEFGKPDCHSFKNGDPDGDPDGASNYFGHIERARIYADRILKRWGYSAEEREEVCFIIERRGEISDADEKNIRDYLEDFSQERLKLLLLFHQAVERASPRGDDLKFKRLAGLL